MSTSIARQQWLDSCASILRTHFTTSAPDAPAIPTQVRISWGFPSARGGAKKGKAIGQCWSPTSTADAHAEIFLHPILANTPDAAMEVAAVLAHELVHAAVGVQHGHKKPFSKLARSIGLEGKMTATTPGDTFKHALRGPLHALGPFPTTGLDPTAAPGKKQSTRLLKCECPACHYKARVTKKHIEALGPPICPCNHEPMQCDSINPEPEDGDDNE